jgi:hypothetical protein
LADTTQSNNSYCVGRYAYAIYDEAGLLDANVAGFPSNTTSAQYGAKGVSAFADLTVLGLSQNDIDAMVGWRNYFSAGPSGSFPSFNFNAAAATNYVASVLSNTNGFMNVPVPSSTPNNMSNTDQQFTTRQSLINLLVNSGLSANAPNALQYLGTFSRELNAPSWAPTRNATDMGAPNNGTGNIYAYKDNAANPAATPINPNLLNVTVQNSFTRADGNTANVGEPLIDRRFPLTRINGLADPTFPASAQNSTIVNGVPSPASATTVQRDFGLLWSSTSNRWDYVGPTGSAVQNKIETLWQVANEQREPNFFELLKAVILNGSVGMGSGSANTFVAAQPKYYDNTGTNGPTSSDYQIMQIGANIINQWDSRNVPIFFNFYDSTGNYELAGIKNLPYFNKLVFEPSWTTVHGGGPYQFDAWLLPSLWNPHQNATSATGTVQIAMTSGALSAITTSPNITTSSIVASPTPISMTVNANAFATPSAPTSAGSIVGSITKSPDGYYGFHISPTPSPTASPDNTLATAYPYFGSTGCTFELRVQVNGSWKTYERWQTYASPSPSPVVCQSPPAPKRWLDRGSNNALQDPEFVALDPRTVRFGVWANAAIQSGNSSDYTSGTQTSLDVSANPSPSPGTFEKITALGPNGPQFFASPSPTPTLYLYAFNTDSAVYYTDLDGVERRGDSPTSGLTSVMQTANAGNAADRPLLLAGAYQNGVFQSVTELGHVFRDQPWKTISFGAAASSPSPYPTASPYPTPRSADAGLLEVFTLHESSIEAGKTSLNTRQAPVLKAILTKAALNLTGTSIISSTQIDDGSGHGIVPALTNLTATQPMVNKAELVTRLAADASVTGLGNKEARECVMRAFSDACQTRTWNLLIDLIAQSGRYSPNANSLAGFTVEGEQHYWIHVAIDRFTGQVLDKQIEVVNE